MWRQSHSCNHSTMKYSTFSPPRYKSRGEAGYEGRRSVWTLGVTVFFDVRVTHVNSPVQPGQVNSYDLQRARKREEEEIQPESDGCTDGNFYTTGVWYKQGHGTRLSEPF